MWKNFYKSVFVAVLFCFCLFPFRNATGTKKENVASSYISVMAILKTFFFSSCMLHINIQRLHSGQHFC